MPGSALPTQFTANKCDLLAELSVNAGRSLTYEHLMEEVWKEKADANMSPMRAVGARLSGKPGEDACNPVCIFTETRMGYWMPVGEGPDLTPGGY